jgi:hypothetical protein
MSTERVYSTGEVATLLKISRTYLKVIARVANINPPRFGCHRQDRIWSESHITALRPLIKRNGKQP